MIISNNKKPSIIDFSNLVLKATEYLNSEAKKREEYYLQRHAQKLEDDVRDALIFCAINTPFENSIEKISGQKFPDIVASKYYGVEVKSSKDIHWTTIGGSINESTRIEDVERIFLTFGKLVAPVEFRSRPYEECLSEVVVTHYPRYKINMTLTKGNTIFDKMGITYDDLRKSESAVKRIVAYYKAQMKEGETLWWIDNQYNTANISSTSMFVKLWRTLNPQEKHDLIISGFVLFPEILSDSSAKYERYSLWLASHHSVISTSMRDTFTAGGQKTIITDNGFFENVPQVIYKIFCFREEILLRLLLVEENILKEYWKVTSIENDRVKQLIDLMSYNYTIKNHSISQILKAIFNK